MFEALPFKITGHVLIEDDLGKIYVDQDNAVHPQNMARVMARSLSNESNAPIYRIAFGNGGTLTDAAFTITYNTPNDGQPPDVRTWDSRLYNETYSEVIDESSPLLGTDPGSASLRPRTPSAPRSRCRSSSSSIPFHRRTAPPSISPASDTARGRHPSRS